MHKVQSVMYGDEAENLLDLVVPATTADTNIHTFSEFKQWINTGFQLKTQLNSASYIKKKEMVRSLKLKQAKSFSGSDHPRQNKMIGSLKHRPSISFQTLDQIEEGVQDLENSNMASSRRSRKASHGGGQLGFQLRQNSEVKSHSAQSSRSFNGYDQINQYQMRELLGKGSFADVYLGVDTQSDGKEKYAIKVLESKQIKKKLLLKKNSQILDSPPPSLQETEHKPKEQESLASMFVRNEVAILKKMSHQYITKLFDVIFDSEKGRVYLVLEYCGGGFINQNKDHKGQYRKLLQSECKRYTKQLALALQYIHNVAKIAHRDIKPENILLSEFDQVKVSDFGLGTHKLKGKKASGTPLYMPPQAQNVEGDTANQPGDIWALGVTLLVLLSGKHPDFSDHKIDVAKVVGSLKDLSQHCKHFIYRCLEVDPTKRIKAEELLAHEWLGADLLRVTNPLTLTTTNYGISVTPADEQNVFKAKQIIRPKKDPQTYKFQFK